MARGTTRGGVASRGPIGSAAAAAAAVVLLLLLAALLSSTTPPHTPARVLFVDAGWDVGLSVVARADGARGGSPFDAQPIVAVNDLRGELRSSFEGRMTVSAVVKDASSSSSGGGGEEECVPVWKQQEGGVGGGGGGGATTSCSSDDDLVSEAIIGGYATFAGLGIDVAGRYRLRFVLYDEHGLVMDSMLGDELDVSVGAPHHLGLVVPPEGAYGGSAFGSQPILAVQDRGGNAVTTAAGGVSGGTVAATLHDGPAGSTLRCAYGADGLDLPVGGDGLVAFRGLFIDEAADRYSLRFVLSGVELEGGGARYDVVSDEFSVGAGPAAEIALIVDASDGPALGGTAFARQPRAEVRDAGGNVLVDDSHSAVRVSLYSNPSRGALLPEGATTRRLEGGVAQFRGLSIDRAGVGYRLAYQFLEYDHEEARLRETSVSVEGSYFDVEVGQPHRLSIIQHSAGGWAGNQPFPVQPKVALVDAGGNIVLGDSSSTVTAHLTSSLAQNSRVIIDTTNDDVPHVTGASFAQHIMNDERQSYGPGDVIRIDVLFSQEVAIFQTGDAGALPQLALNVLDGGSGPGTVFGELVLPREGIYSRTISFEYLVKTGHSQAELDFSSSDSISVNDYSIEDAFGRSATLTLPASSLTASKAIEISDDRPVVESIVADLPTAEYGAGDEVMFTVNFDRHVAVSGVPELPVVNVESLLAIIDVSTMDIILPESFFNVLYNGERSSNISWDASALDVKIAIESMASIAGEVCVSRANSLSSGGVRWAIRMEHVRDDVLGMRIDDSGFRFSGSGGVLDVNFIATDALSGDWVTMCTARTAAYVDGNGSKSLAFSFQILPGDTTNRLDVASSPGAELIFSTTEDQISLITMSPEAEITVDPNIEGIALPADQIISIDTSSPYVTSIAPQSSTTPNGTYAVGDSLFFEVVFDKPVEVDVGLELLLNTESGVARYISGSGTDTLLLEYTVNEGDSTSNLDKVSLVAQSTEGGRSPVLGQVRRMSLSPSTDANLDISHIPSFTEGHHLVIEGVRPFLLDISIDESDRGRTLGRGDTFAIMVTFSAPIVVSDSSPPILALLVGTSERQRWATYTSGSGSSILRFLYRVSVGDSSLPFELKYQRICQQERDCTNTDGLVVSLSATLELDADLDTGFADQGTPIASTHELGVTIDTSDSPATTVVSTNTPKDPGTYGVGEIIDILVTFSDQVDIAGTKPTLLMNTGNFATYLTGKGTDTLTFRYVFAEGDLTTSSLDWSLDPVTNSAVGCTGSCVMENENGVAVDVRYYDPDNDVALVAPLDSMIAFDTSPPTIVSVTTDKAASPYCHPTCSYTVGEEIAIFVSFDRPVVVHGDEIFLAMDVGEGFDARAVYNPPASTENILAFIYTVSHGHSTNGSSLNYLCSSECSLEHAVATSLKRAASIPTTDADLSLPLPSVHGISGDEMIPIIIDTSGQPTVVSVSSTTLDGEYAPGCSIEILVQFSSTVEVTGNPYLTLDVGTSPTVGVASYKTGSGTTGLVFEYVVGLGHKTLDLDYNDSHSLHLGFDGVNHGSIRQASSNPTVDAVLDLPVPRSTGSLSANSNVSVDSRRPFISSITASPGVYSTDDSLSIHVQFSRPVTVSGTPSLLLSTSRSAKYVTQLDDFTLELAYTVELGDVTTGLDYWSDEELFPSSRTGFNLNDGSIKLQAKNGSPILDADLHINPTDGTLGGDKSVQITEGVALFRDLKIQQRGKDYKIWFQSNVDGINSDLQVAEVVQIDTSVEYQVQGDSTNSDEGDLYGSAVSLHSNTLVIGAQGKRNPTPEIQVLTVYAEAEVEEHEVQVITTSVNREEAVRSSLEFSTCADAGEAIGGSFTLMYNINGAYDFSLPMIFASDVCADQLKLVLEEELNLAGLIIASRSVNPTCDSVNSWTWSVAFLDSSEGVAVLETNGDSLTGQGAHISDSVPSRSVEMLGGSFQLLNPQKGLISRDIPFDASSSTMKDIIEDDLGIALLSVQVENIDSTGMAELGRRWTLVVSHHESEYGRDTNVPQLQAKVDNLLGADANVWTHTAFEGRGILSGDFALSFRGSDPSLFISHDSSEEELKVALESLDSINEVTVSNRRTFANEVGKSGVSWTITFNSVNMLTNYGWLPDPGGASSGGNLQTLEVTSHLIGWNAGCFVQSETGRGEEDTQAQWMAQQKGMDGILSGSVDVFRNVREGWQKEATLLAADYNSNDLFGASVSVAGDYLLVGAPSKQVDGLPEKQKLSCAGPSSEGFFQLHFRGFTSSPIPHDATLLDIQNSVVGLYGSTGNIHTTPRLSFASDSEGGWSGGFCGGSSNSLSITFVTPDGGGVSTVEERAGDLELLTVDASNLIDASITVEESRKGTVAPMGKDLNNSQPTGKQSGSVYLFKRSVSCPYCEPVWTEMMKFTPMSGFDSPTNTAEFGSETLFVSGPDPADNLVIIGSPGFNQGSGKVYIFHVVEGMWVLLDSLSDQNWNHNGNKGGRFGSAIAADNDTILVGSPSTSIGGAVYVFRRSSKGKPFLASQVITPGDLQVGDQFGHSLSLAGDKAVICAPLKATNAIHLTTLAPTLKQGGACYIFTREDPASSFEQTQMLTPSNILAGDRFGWSVAMTSDRIVVGQVQDATGKQRPPRPVQVIRTFCDRPPCNNAAASSFRLRWADGTQWTPFLVSTTTANQMRGAIEANLLTGAASVSRSVLPDEDGGHSWHVMFDSYDSVFRETNRIPIIECDMSAMSSLSCETQVIHDIPQDIRGKAHLFDFDDASQTWTEQSFLFSSSPQRQDMFGTSVAIDENFVVAGAPKREPFHDNVGSGAALIFDISFLGLTFPDGPYSLSEGDVATINVERNSSDEPTQIFSMRSVDRNADEAFQYYISDLFSLHSLDMVHRDRTPVELLTGNTASGRSQYYGSGEERSLFLRGMYDAQGINDYALFKFEGQLKQGERVVSTAFKTTDDNILETPSERVTIQFDMRGMFASQLGRLKVDVTMADNGDGITSEGRTQYQALGSGGSREDFERTGAAIDVDRAIGMLVVGNDQTSAVDDSGAHVRNVGSVTVYKTSSSGSWEFMETLLPPSDDVQPNMNFGQSVSIDDTHVLVGAPGAATAYVYTFQLIADSWTLEAVLSATDATLSSEDKFGSRGAVCVHENMAFVGSSSMETVYVYRRSYSSSEARWDPYSVIRSNDFDYDVYGHGFTINHVHRQGFGTALAASGRTLLVGAPFADYGNRGDVHQREHFDTDGIHNRGLGKGKVYAFYSQPHVQMISLESDEKISAGSFTLKLGNADGAGPEISGHISHDSTSDMFKVALEYMPHVGNINVERDEKVDHNSYRISWKVSFVSNFEDDHPLLVPQWHGHGCDECEQLKVSVLSTVEPFITVQSTHVHQPYTQEGEMQPRDVTSTDAFGATLSLDGPQAIVGSMHSTARTRTTYDFETGTTIGWSSTGTAFQYQPTFGDNSKHRAVYEGYGAAASHSSGESQGSRLMGRYYIATYEKRPGVQDGDYMLPDGHYPLASTQGDEPMGTLTSDPFIIRGPAISFLIGGGCNHLTAYVELLVDGYPSLRATGKCSEKMTRAVWNVEMFEGRAGQIRIVDAGTDTWDHINIDDIVILDSRGGGGAMPKTHEKQKQHYMGGEESPMAGAAYMFLYECDPRSVDDLSPSNEYCSWREEERLVASDKRGGNRFGFSVDVDHEQGVAIVGSPFAPAYGLHGEPVAVHPFSNATVNLPIPEDLEDMMKSGITYSATGGNIRLIDYLASKRRIDIEEASRYTEDAGAVYVFVREPARYGPTGEIAHKPFWRTTEHSKIAPPDVAAKDNFGFSVALDGTDAAMGAVGRRVHAENQGGAFYYDMEWTRLQFTSVEYVAREGDGIVKIFVERDLSWSNSRYSIGYSTSDLTAVGVDAIKFDDCISNFSSIDRDGCGDYEQSSGEVTFNAGEQHAYLTIRIMDDRCVENHMEYVQLTLHQIGGSPLRGEQFRSQLRIDDDDWPGNDLSMNCTGGVSTRS